jgi:DNA-binding transcriptional ArsR family regulator
VADIFTALADGTRRVLMDELLHRDEQTLFELCSKLAMNHGVTPSRQAVTQHLDVLAAAGLVRIERRGRYRLHTIDTAPLAQISERWPIRKELP